MCAQVCPVDAIEYEPHERHAVDVETCTRCNMCFEICQDGAVDIVSRGRICATSTVTPVEGR
jgi:NADH-quinone oxidoreductase subunit F